MDKKRIDYLLEFLESLVQCKVYGVECDTSIDFTLEEIQYELHRMRPATTFGVMIEGHDPELLHEKIKEQMGKYISY